MKHNDAVSGGFRQLLYGPLVPSNLLKAYVEDAERFLALNKKPDSPDSYLQVFSGAADRWRAFREELDETTWKPPFYMLPQQSPPFHALCLFYQSMIYAESRMIVALFEKRFRNMELSLFKFELLTLQEDLAALMKECEIRLEVANGEEPSLERRLSRFMLPLLRDHLLMLLQELADRYGHLLEDRLISVEDVYLNWLYTPIPAHHRWVRTEEGVRFWLEKSLRGPAGHRNEIVQLLAGVYSDDDRTDAADAEIKEQLDRSQCLLENVLLSYVGCVETGLMDAAGLLDDTENVRRLEQWMELLHEKQPAGESIPLDHLLRRMAWCRKIIRVDDGRSEAVRFLSRLGRVFTSVEAPGPPTEPLAVSEPVSSRTHAHHWALEKYISLDEVREKLGVHANTLSRYLKESGVPVITFSQKNKWMHVDDFHDFMQLHKKNNDS